MMDDLEMPDDFSSRRANRDDAIGEQAVAETDASEEVRCGAAGWNENEIARRIGRDRGPRIRRPSFRCIVRRPRLPSGLILAARNRIPRPDLRAVARVECAD